MDNNFLTAELRRRMLEKLEFLYGRQKADWCIERIEALIKEYTPLISHAREVRLPDERDVMVITYGDQVYPSDSSAPLRCLSVFLEKHFGGLINTVHLLPVYPYSSDDGFSVIDYWKIDKQLGNWNDISEMKSKFQLMLDVVMNHVSSQSVWFQECLEGNPKYRNFFIEMDKNTDVSAVTRPRTLPLLTPFQCKDGERYFWTTFSEDQIDLNYQNPDVLLSVIELLMFYVKQGAKLLRLDAIGYLWKKPGTSCINLKETHTVIRLFRDVLDAVYPGCRVVTETNIPHAENVSYFADGMQEAQMVYQFALPPLVMHAFFRGRSNYLSSWAKSLDFPQGRATYLNFLASHDGIGVMPVKDILPCGEVEAICRLAEQRGGAVSYKNNPDGSQSPYELNITYYDAVADPNQEQEIQVKKFLCSQGIMLAMRGMPGIYINSLFGCRNDLDGVKKTGRYRSINRKKHKLEELEQLLAQPQTVEAMVETGMKKLLTARTRHKAFRPDASQQVLDAGISVFAILRCTPDHTDRVLCLFNVSDMEQSVALTAEDGLPNRWRDIFTGREVKKSGNTLEMVIQPYDVIWLEQQ